MGLNRLVTALLSFFLRVMSLLQLANSALETENRCDIVIYAANKHTKTLSDRLGLKIGGDKKEETLGLRIPSFQLII